MDNNSKEVQGDGVCDDCHNKLRQHWVCHVVAAGRVMKGHEVLAHDVHEANREGRDPAGTTQLEQPRGTVHGKDVRGVVREDLRCSQAGRPEGQAVEGQLHVDAAVHARDPQVVALDAATAALADAPAHAVVLRTQPLDVVEDEARDANQRQDERGHGQSAHVVAQACAEGLRYGIRFDPFGKQHRVVDAEEPLFRHAGRHVLRQGIDHLQQPEGTEDIEQHDGRQRARRREALPTPPAARGQEQEATEENNKHRHTDKKSKERPHDEATGVDDAFHSRLRDNPGNEKIRILGHDDATKHERRHNEAYPSDVGTT
mmetsp:Transcript_17348/g.55517  ORF Transcript_17348/g.55517 Transcript_17348/m.55517 type:complete len:315 (+) Transcript_17348:359-1303(+)